MRGVGGVVTSKDFQPLEAPFCFATFNSDFPILLERNGGCTKALVLGRKCRSCIVRGIHKVK